MTANTLFIFTRKNPTPEYRNAETQDIDTFAVWAQTSADALAWLKLSYPAYSFALFNPTGAAPTINPADLAGWTFEVSFAKAGSPNQTFTYVGVGGDTDLTVATAMTALFNAAYPFASGGTATDTSGSVALTDMTGITVARSTATPPQQSEAYNVEWNPAGLQGTGGVPGMNPTFSGTSTVTIVFTNAVYTSAPYLMGAFHNEVAAIAP